MKTHLIKLPRNIHTISVHARMAYLAHIIRAYISIYIYEHILGDKYIYFNLSLSIYIYIVGGQKTHLYIRMHFMLKGAGASNNVCVHSIDDP